MVAIRRLFAPQTIGLTHTVIFYLQYAYQFIIFLRGYRFTSSDNDLSNILTSYLNRPIHHLFSYRSHENEYEMKMSTMRNRTREIDDHHSSREIKLVNNIYPSPATHLSLNPAGAELMERTAIAEGF